MILSELVELAKRRPDLPPVGCWERSVAATVELDGDGVFQKCILHKPAKESVLPKFWFPFIQPTNSGKPSIGIHKLEHLLGTKFRVSGKEQKRQARQEENAAVKAKALLLRQFALWCTQRHSHPRLKAWQKFISDEKQVEALWQELAKQVGKHALAPSDYAAIRIDGHSWWQEDAIVEFWRTEARDVSDAAPDLKGKRRELLSKGLAGAEIVECITAQCLVCGKHTEVERLVPSFDSLIRTKEGEKVVPDKLKFTSFNRAAYASRSLKKSYNAPICKICSDRSAKGWNGLMTSESSHELLDDEVLGFWGDIELKPWGRKAIDTKTWRDLLRSSRTGTCKLIAPEGINLLGLGAHESSAYVTCWLKRDAQRGSAAVLKWWHWQDLFGDSQPEAYTLTDLIMSLRPRSQWYEPRRSGKASSLMSSGERKLWRSLLCVSLGAGHVPTLVLANLTSRFAAEMETSFASCRTPRMRKRGRSGIESDTSCYPLDRLVLLNICLCSFNNLEVINVNNLTERQRNAFNSGRIFNLICYAQREAIGETGKTVLASNARLAATRPSQILGELITRLQHVYYPKLKRDKTGLYVWIDTLLKGLIGETEFLPSHSSEETGWFWRGFYSSDMKDEFEHYRAEQRKKGTVQ